MTTEDYGQLPEEELADQLTVLLEGLHYSGLTVGVDDASRLAAVFPHFGVWSRSRRVRVLKTLLARSREERMMIEQLGPHLFPEGGPKESSRSEEREDPALSHTAIDEPDPAGRKRAVRRHGRVPGFWRSAGISICLGLILTAVLIVSLDKSIRTQLATRDLRSISRTEEEVSRGLDYHKRFLDKIEHLLQDERAYLLGQKHAENDLESETFQPEKEGTNKAVSTTSEGTEADGETSAGPAPPRKPASEPREPAALEPGADEFAAENSSTKTMWVSILLFIALSSSVRWFLLLEERRQNILKLAEAKGPRIFIPDYPYATGPVSRHLLREIAFQLAAPRATAATHWLDESMTVDETARSCGKVALCYSRWREHRPIVFVEDVGGSMARCADLGKRLGNSLCRQGAAVTHMYMHQTPDRVYFSRNLRKPEPLSRFILSIDVESSDIIVLSDASGLDFRFLPQLDSWLGSLRDALWLHPQPPELWGRGARWLATQVRMAPITEGGLLRPTSPSWKGDFPRRWSPPRVSESNDDTARLGAYQACLGEAAFWWLSAGAVIEQNLRLTARLMWGLRDAQITPVESKDAYKIWELNDVQVGPDAFIGIEQGLRDALASNLKQSRTSLYVTILDWLEELVSYHLKTLPKKSLALVSARSCLIQLRSSNPSRAAAAAKDLRPFVKEGYGAWLRLGVDVSPRLLFIYWTDKVSRAMYRTLRSLLARLSLASSMPAETSAPHEILRPVLVTALMATIITMGLLASTRLHYKIARQGARIIEAEQVLHRALQLERRLRLEASFLSNPERIEQRARAELGMKDLSLAQTLFLEELADSTSEDP